MKRRVVVTGLGAVTPIGNDVESFWNGVKEGRTETAAEHKPDYLRVSQAERERAQKLKKGSEGENA